MSTTSSDALNHLLQNWKTTVSGVLTTLIGAGVYFAAVPTATIQQLGITQRESAWFTVAVGLAKIVLAVIQKDAQ